MGPSVVVNAKPVSDRPAGMLQQLEPIPVRTLLLQGSDHALDHAVLLGAVRCDEVLAQAVSSNEGREATTGEHESVVRTQKEQLGHFAERPKSREQRLLERRLRGLRSAAARKMPAQQLAAAALDHQRQRRPAITSCPNPAQIRRPAFVRSLCRG
jgi:hypothetical protein